MADFGYRTTAAEAVAGIDLTGKHAIVTGGYSGIGIETVRALAGAGAQVTIGVRNACLLYTSPSPRDLSTSRMPSSA